MAIGVSLLTEGNGVSASSHTTASITPSANALVLVFVCTTTSTSNVPSLSGNGLTWVAHYGPVNYSGDGTQTVFRAMGASPSSGAVTISHTVASNCRWIIVEFTGVNTSGTNGSGAIQQSTANSNYGGTSVTVTLGAFSSADNATCGGFWANRNTTPTGGSGFAILGSQQANNRRLAHEYKLANDTTVDMSYSNSGNQHGWAAEIKVAAAADPVPVPLSRIPTMAPLIAA